MGTNPKVCFLGGMGGRSLVVSQGRKVELKEIFQGIILLVVGERGWVFCFLVCFSFVIW
jgi:hypothetical protein